MKKFLFYILSIASIVISLMAVFEVLYTYVYTHAPARNKYQYIIQQQPQKIDLIFLGSSRTANHIVTKEVRRITGKSAMNFGMEGAVLQDNMLELKLLLERQIKMDVIFLQVDYLYEHEGLSNIANSSALPYIHNPVIRDFLNEQLPNTTAMYYVPFYRYLITDYTIGFREFFFSLIKKKPKIDLTNGFSPKIGVGKMEQFDLPQKVAAGNATLDSIALLCKANNIELILFCAPFCSQTRNIEYIQKLKKKLPALWDYSKAMDDKHFHSCGHLNEGGAEIFTRMLIQDYLTQIDTL